MFLQVTLLHLENKMLKMCTNGRNIQVQMYSNISIYTMGIKCQELLHPGERSEH